MFDLPMPDDSPRGRVLRVLEWPLRIGGLAMLVWAVAITPPGMGLHGQSAWALTGIVVAASSWLLWGVVQRRSDPVRISVLAGYLLGGALLLPGSSHTGIGLVFICISALIAAHRLPVRAACVFGAATVLAVVVATVPFWSLTNVFVAVLVLASAFMGGLLRRQRQDKLEQAELLIAETQVAKAEQARSAALAERGRLAREIHDVLAHSLGALSVQLEAADALLEDVPEAAKARACVSTARGLAREGLTETRRAVAALRGHGRPLQDSLSELAERYRADSGALVSMAVPAELPEVPPDLTLALLRLAQEALTNVRRYAANAPVEIRLDQQDDRLELSVHNGASPHGPAPTRVGGGFGLTGMRERLELLGGTVQAGADAVREGWTVTATAPLKAAR